MSFNPQPSRTGDSKDTNLEAILNDLRQSLGTAFDVDYGSNTWIYLNAMARVFNEVFELNKRLANQWDPARMTDFLSRWEKILGIIPLDTDTFVDRRIKIQAKLELTGKVGTQQVITDLLVTILGDVFVGILNNDSNSANAYVAGGATIPGGATIADGTPVGLPWYSTVSYIPIEVTQPDYMDDLTFYQTVAQIFTFLQAIMPAWTTYRWFRKASNGTNTFILDDIHNLDNSVMQ